MHYLKSSGSEFDRDSAMLAPMYSIPMCTLECSHLGSVLCLYEEPLLDLIESIHVFGWWFLRWGILEYKQWIRPSLTSTFCSRRFLLLLLLLGLLLLCVGWDSQLQQFNLCLIFISLANLHLNWEKKEKEKKKKEISRSETRPRRWPKLFTTVQMTCALVVRTSQDTACVPSQPPLATSSVYASVLSIADVHYSRCCIGIDTFHYIRWRVVKHASSVGPLTERPVVFSSRDIDYWSNSWRRSFILLSICDRLYTLQRKDRGGCHGHHVLIHYYSLCIRQ